MQSVKEFMRRYIAEHIAEEKRQLASLKPFRRRFYTADCVWSSRPGMLELLQSEKIESIFSSDSKAEAITRRELPETSESHYFLRYHLETRGDIWMISEVDLQYCSCGGKPGNTDCPNCYGTGWRGTNSLRAKTTASARKPTAKKKVNT